MLLRAADSLLLVVDIQTRLVPAMFEVEPVVANATRLVRAASLLAVPTLVSEHCANAIGKIVPEIAALAPEGSTLPKTHFSCAAEPALAARVAEARRRQLLIAGIEAHVCVLQTALGFRSAGYDVFVVADATTSRRPESKNVALGRVAAAGASVVTTEMVVFEWLERADRAEFRSALGFVK